MIRSLSIDIETFSSEDLTKSGVYRYAEAPDFRILLFGYSFNGSPVYVIDLASGQKITPGIILALMDPSVEKNAFNASFERVCLSRFLRDMDCLKEGEFLSPEGWRCSMIRCAYLGLPLSLASAGSVLGLDKQKLTEGKDLIRFFCMPAKPSLLNGKGEPLSTASGGNFERGEVNRSKRSPRWGVAPTEVAVCRNFSSTDPERWKCFMEYNRRDVEVEMQIQERLRHYPVPESVWKEYELDQQINDRGIAVDGRLVSAALAMDEMSRNELTAELSQRTALANPNSVSQIRQWLTDHGSEVESLGKKQVAAMLKDAAPEIREVLMLRQQLAKSSVKKYEAMRNTVCADGRIRGMFQFYGASRSGRWAGRGVQLQNLPQNHLPDLDQARETVLAGDYGVVKTLYDSVPDVLSELIRTAFVPKKGKRFIVADFSAIEARVIAWLAGESWRLEVFASGGDIYCASASQMFHVPVEKHGVNGHLRQKGKIAELALGYGGGAGALKAMGALEMGVAEEELQPLVNAWRRVNPNICRLWWDVDKAVKTAIREKTTVRLGRLSFSCRSGMLFILLPSGRALSYVKPRFSLNRFGAESVEYYGLNAAKKWDRIESYGPKFVENIVQGISRDLLCCAMMGLEERGYRIVAHVHDEVIVEADPEDSIEEICRIMGQCPDWAKSRRPPVEEISSDLRSSETSDLPGGGVLMRAVRENRDHGSAVRVRYKRRLSLRTDGLVLRADGYTCNTYRKD